MKKTMVFFFNFINFLQKELPLENNLKILFLKKKKNNMTTGSRSDSSTLNVLVGGRMHRDILRTLAHEWTHEYQTTILGRKKGTDIGGINEDEANASAGRLVKMFEKQYPSFENKMYE